MRNNAVFKLFRTETGEPFDLTDLFGNHLNADHNVS